MLMLAVIFCGDVKAEIDGRTLAVDFYKLVVSGDAQELLSAFGDAVPRINTPRTGAVVGRDAVVQFVKEEREWLIGYGLDENSITVVRITESPDRVVFELQFRLENTVPSKQHKAGVVVDLNGDKASDVRVYYSLSGITGKHDFSRLAFMDYDPALFDTLVPPMKQYFASIENAYLDVYRMFTDDGCFGHACGTEKRKKVFVVLMHAGSVPLRLTSVTCNDSACATEWNLASWGDTLFSAEIGGMSVFEFDESGRIMSGWAYDDIHEAPFSQPGWFVTHWPELSRKFEYIGCPMSFEMTADVPDSQAFKKVLANPCDTN